MVTLDALSRALRHVQRELDAVGLFEGCLDQIDVVLAYLPSGWWGEYGFVYDRGIGAFAAFAGFREGTVYIPWNSPISRQRGDTLRDVLRHEHAHALAWVRPSFVRGAWFREAFGARYDDVHATRPAFDTRAFVSVYATTSAAEDFAETFAAWLRGDVRQDRAGNKISAIDARLRRRGRR